MATIVTVHGTFASGPEEGDKWWQRGSPFTNELRNLVMSEDGGAVQIEPHVWDGLNSETSRVAAGKSLAERFGEHDDGGHPFVAVGHSHGGSVISAALLHAARARRKMPAMKGWVTVGTPFIRTRRQRFLFSRLGLFGRAIYLTLLTFLLVGALAMFVGLDTRTPLQWLHSLLVFLGPLVVFYFTLRFLEKRRSLRFNRKILDFAADAFGGRWLSLWHAKDEAVQSLKAVKRLDLEIFSTDFASSALNLLAIAAVPIAFFVMLTSESTMVAIVERITYFAGPDFETKVFKSAGTNIYENAVALFFALMVLPASIFAGPDYFRAMSADNPYVVLVFVALGLAVLVGMAVLATWVFSQLANLVSHGLSLVLNPVTNAQLKSVAFGSDTNEGIAVDASEWPTWIVRGFPPLTSPVGDDIERASNDAISLAIPKFRNIVESLAEADTPEATSDVLADYLTWNELIHTSYFDHPRFAKLVAYAICQSDGFKPTPGFERDPDYAEVAQTYAAIVAGARTSLVV